MCYCTILAFSHCRNLASFVCDVSCAGRKVWYSTIAVGIKTRADDTIARISPKLVKTEHVVAPESIAKRNSKLKVKLKPLVLTGKIQAFKIKSID